MTALRRFTRAMRDALRPDRRLKVSQWAEENRVLPPDTPEPGPWRNARTPHLIDIQDTMSPGSGFREGWNKKGVQLGGSASGENFIGAAICTAAGSILVVFPTLEDAKQWELQRFEPMRLATKELRRRVLDSGGKKSDNTKLRKKFPGGVMRLVTAGRAGALKSMTIRYIKFEEPDEYVMDVGRQGSPIGLVLNRAKNFGMKARIYGDGTPTVEGSSAIDTQYKRGDQRKRYMRCPHCSLPQFFEWKQMRWTDDDPSTAHYACKDPDCACREPEHVWKSGVNWMRPLGWTEQQCKAAGYAYWEATAKGEPGVASWHLPSLYAPLGWRPWTALVAAWLAAQNDPTKLKEFFNNELAECWQDKVHTTTSAETIQQRAESYPLFWVPSGGLVVVAGVDTQDNRLAVVIRAYGRGEQSWGIFHGEIYGNPSTAEPWIKLRELLEAPIKHASGQILRVDAAGIDSGGHHTEDVYAFTRDAGLRGKHWFAIKGAPKYDAVKLGRPKPMEFTWRGQPVAGGATLRQVGTQGIKNLLDGRLRIAKHGDGFMHFPLGFQPDYYAQLRGEKREWRRDRAGNKALWWTEVSGVRNEAWDCEVYAYAAYLYTMSGRHAEQVLRGREKMLAVQHADLFEVAPPAPVEEPTLPPAALAALPGHVPVDDGDPPPDEPDAAEDEPAAVVDAPPDEHEDVPDVPAPPRRRQARPPRRGFATNW